MRYLLDTSAWVAFARERDTPRARAARAFVEERFAELVVCSPVRLELGLDPDELRRRRLFRVHDTLTRVDIRDDDFELTAGIYRAVRAQGHTIRSLIDCLIAAIAVRADVTVVHDDIDFERMASVVPDLSVVRMPGWGVGSN